jgi:hypothetical protein
MIYKYGEPRWNYTDREKRKTRRKTCPNATLSTTSPTWTDAGAKPGFHRERPATTAWAMARPTPMLWAERSRSETVTCNRLSSSVHILSGCTLLIITRVNRNENTSENGGKRDNTPKEGFRFSRCERL